ncbi:MAG TPA: tetratricopeptide repeat protein [Chloroflexia bacterium]|nr:tetratricopeptide repeat protein [Chloroflexia bacterium]
MTSFPTQRLPSPATPLIGREKEVADVRALLGRAAVRLLTLTGPGGIGKTRLALAVCEAEGGEFPDGVYYVPLAQVADSSLVLPAVAQGLGVREVSTSGGKSSIRAQLQKLIGRQKLLLVLDNFEQVIAAATDIALLLDGCPNLKVLVTSREGLHLSAEYQYPVPPLALPDLQNLPPLSFLAHIEAVRLFVTRALAVLPDFALTGNNALAIASICHRLDGLPLAIELAAARVRLLPPIAMLARLERLLPLLTGGSVDTPARHRTLRAAIAWSYDLLEPGEQQMFRRLTIFVGGFTLDAVPALYMSDDGERQPSLEDILQTLASLLDKSLLRRSPTATEQDRLYMLATIREYAREQLVANNEEEAVKRAHAAYYLALAEEAEIEMIGPHEPAWLARLEQEHDNLRAALTWAIDSANLEMGARLATSLWGFWLIHGYISEGRRWMDSLLAPERILPPALRGRVLNGAGRLALRQGDYAAAETMLQTSLTIRHNLADTRGEMEVLANLGLAAIYQDDLVKAQSYFERSLSGWRLLGDKRGMVIALNRLGLALRYQGDFNAAAKLYEECKTLAGQLHATYFIAAALHNLGQMEHHRGNDIRAHSLLAESLVLVQQLGDRPSISQFLADMAGVWATQGQPERSALLFGASQVLRDNMGVIMYQAQRRAYEQDVAYGAAQLDAATWEAAWARGRLMSLDDVYAIAVEDLPSPPRDNFDLTARELEVLRLLVAGLTYAQIAEQLLLSFHTVHAHLRTSYSKMGVTSRGQAARFAIEHGLV